MIINDENYLMSYDFSKSLIFFFFSWAIHKSRGPLYRILPNYRIIFDDFEPKLL